MKTIKTLFIFFTLVSFAGLNAQNSIAWDVRNFLSPTDGFNYNSNAAVDVSIRIVNNGPGFIFAQDSLIFDITVANNDSTAFLRVKKRADQTIHVNDRPSYVLLNKYPFSKDHSYTICVTAVATDQYPVNQTKNPRSCISFIVGLDDLKPKAEAIFYQNGNLRFETDVIRGGNAKILDLNGRTIVSQKLNKQTEQNISISSPAKGFYFLQVSDEQGRFGIYKFIVQ